jgi:uncharacterized protein (TIGR03435 family)
MMSIVEMRRDRVKRVLLCIFLSALTSIGLAGQSLLRFEVAAIRPGQRGGRTTVSSSPSGLYTAMNIPVHLLIRHAFGLQLDQLLVGGPEWIRDERIDITARAEIARPSVADRRAMLQSLLAERFGLVTHDESRELPVYLLTQASPDKQLGPRLVRATGCDALARAIQRGEAPAQKSRGAPPVHGMRMHPGTLQFGCMPLATLLSTLISSVDRTVIDETALEGDFNLELEWAHDADSTRASIFVALQEQLGLKLEAARRPVAVRVIDRIERPTFD